MNWITANLNNREIATMLWALVPITLVITRARIGEPIRNLLRALFATKILVPLLLMVGYVAGVSFILRQAGIWTDTSLKGTVFWFLSVGLAMFMSLNKAQNDGTFFVSSIKRGIAVTAILEFVVNLYAFPLWIELMTVPLVFLALMSTAVCESRDEYPELVRVNNRFVAVYGLVVFVFSVYRFVGELDRPHLIEDAKEFALPILLTISIIPFIYVFALVAAYENIFIRIEIFNRNTPLGRHVKRRVARRFHVRLRPLCDWSQRVGNLTVTTKDDVRSLLER